MEGENLSTMGMLYQSFHDSLSAKHYEYIDFLLRHLSTENVSAEMLLGVLTITSTWKDELKARPGFFTKVKWCLEGRYKDRDKVRRMLEGLQ